MTFQERYLYNPQTDLLGKGGFARVYKAYDVLLKREVAIKIFQSGDKAKYGVIEEISKAISLQHSSLLRYYDVALVETTNSYGEKEHLQIGVMELANYGDLRSFITNNSQSPFINTLLIQVLEGLSYLHSMGIIHRDLKPQNILLIKYKSGIQAKISDFGISKDMGSSGESSSAVLGTIEYMAPEQFNPAKYGISGKISTNLDLWSFGIMVYELFTGSSLFGRRSAYITTEQIMNSILSTSERLPEDVSKLSEPYQSVVRQCLVANANARVKEAKELISILLKDDNDIIEENTVPFVLDKITNNKNKEEHIEHHVSNKTTNDKKISGVINNKVWWFFFGLLILFAGIVVVYFRGEQNKKEVKLNQIESNMVYVEGGSLEMGSNIGRVDEKPVHVISLSSFSIGKYEVTQEQWETVVEINPSEHKNCPACPVDNVSWDDVQVFISKLNSFTGKHYRLPSEAEWEYAARGGNRSNSTIYSGSKNIRAVAWYDGNSDKNTHEVGQKQPNELGLYDMTGNVLEWCNDWYRDYPVEQQNNSLSPESGTARVLRGGSWYFNSRNCRVTKRDYNTPDFRYRTYGFRLVLVP